MDIMKKISDWRVGLNLGSFLDKSLVATQWREVWIGLSEGKCIYGHVHSPKGQGKYPGVVFVPGGKSPGTDYDSGSGPTAGDVASLGFSVLHYDPSGRGRTGGDEDYWGEKHQEELAGAIRYFAKLPEVDPRDLGIMSFSIGIVISAGALARFPDLGVRYLYDWEGPSNRFVTTKNDTHKPLIGFPSSDTGFWKDREASRFIGDIRCGYFRYQAYNDHVQGSFKGHAIELINLATEGKALWTRCNSNPPDILYDPEKTEQYYWVPEKMNHKGQVLKYLLNVHETEKPWS